MECKKCGYVWKTKVYRPKECPECKNRNYWDKQICFICGKKNLNHQTHHINGDKKDNLRTNLLLVCVTCHKKIHGKDIKKTNGLTNKDNLVRKYNKLFLQSKHKKYINKG